MWWFSLYHPWCSHNRCCLIPQTWDIFPNLGSVYMPLVCLELSAFPLSTRPWSSHGWLLSFSEGSAKKGSPKQLLWNNFPGHSIVGHYIFPSYTLSQIQWLLIDLCLSPSLDCKFPEVRHRAVFSVLFLKPQYLSSTCLAFNKYFNTKQIMAGCLAGSIGKMWDSWSELWVRAPCRGWSLLNKQTNKYFKQNKTNNGYQLGIMFCRMILSV